MIARPLSVLALAALLGLPPPGFAQEAEAIGDDNSLAEADLDAKPLPDPEAEAEALEALVSDAQAEIARLETALYQAQLELQVAEQSVRRALEVGQSRTEVQADIYRLGRALAARGPGRLASDFCRRALSGPVTDQRFDAEAFSGCFQIELTDQRAVEDFDCSSVLWDVADDGSIRLTGYVETDRDLRYLRRVYGAAAVRTIEIKPYPVCKTLEALEPVETHTSQAFDLPATIASAPRVQLLEQRSHVSFGASLAFEVVSPDFPSFLYIVYFQADGSVVNLLPRLSSIRAQHLPGTRLLFGDGRQGRQTYTASAPAGTEMIVAIAARSPIQELEELESLEYRQFVPGGSPIDQSRFLSALDAGMRDAGDGENRSGRHRDISSTVIELTISEG